MPEITSITAKIILRMLPFILPESHAPRYPPTTAGTTSPSNISISTAPIAKYLQALTILISATVITTDANASPVFLESLKNIYVRSIPPPAPKSPFRRPDKDAQNTAAISFFFSFASTRIFIKTLYFS